MNFLDLVESIIIEQYNIEKIKEKYVDNDKKLSEKIFNEIVSVSKNKFNYIAWLTVKVANNIIDVTDIYKFEKYFQIFDRYKNKFRIKDIHQYKTTNDIKEFIEKCVNIMEKDITTTDNKLDIENIKNYVTTNDILKLENVGIKYLGMNSGYQIFEIPSTTKDDDNAWKVYQEILGRCANRDKGAEISICTMASFNHFNDYFNRYPDSSYFVLFNLGDSKSPYQLHFESKQFMDKNDIDIF